MISIIESLFFFFLIWIWISWFFFSIFAVWAFVLGFTNFFLFFYEEKMLIFFFLYAETQNFSCNDVTVMLQNLMRNFVLIRFAMRYIRSVHSPKNMPRGISFWVVVTCFQVSFLSVTSAIWVPLPVNVVCFLRESPGF